jgi:hypothetical protein
MIAHRLQTIMTAQNLLYIENSNTMLAGAKGTPEYEDIMQKLQEQVYKHQKKGETDERNKEGKNGQKKEDEDEHENTKILATSAPDPATSRQ